MRHIRAQSAMEYLMTYGWAILIIAVVLAVLFSLGIFNANTYGGRAHAGSCTVQRPYGPNTTQLVSLSGLCNGQMPQFVGYFNGNGYITVGGSGSFGFDISNPFSISAWIKPGMAAPQWNPIFSKDSDGADNGYYVDVRPVNSIEFAIKAGGAFYTVDSNTVVNDNTWRFVTVTYDGSGNKAGMRVYINGVLENTGASAAMSGSATNTDNAIIGAFNGGVLPIGGQFSNVQLYSSALSANDVGALYLEGIGGAPISLQSLAGWWPLNGDGVDYSGNGDNGAISNVIWTSQWTNGYTQP